jgi:FkbM family methyltransferase
MRFKATIRRHLDNSGLYVRRTAGLSVGVDLFQDLRKFNIRPKCVFDIGAHHGVTALGYADAFLGSCVFAFEPAASNFSQLKRATAHNPDVVAINCAVGDQPGIVSMRLNADNSQAHSVVSIDEEDAETVDITTVDKFCAEQRLFPDFIKIDAEGFELKVIAGAQRTLGKSPRAVLAEATLSMTNKRHVHLSYLAAALEPYGFRMAGLYDQCRWETTDKMEYFNSLFIK